MCIALFCIMAGRTKHMHAQHSFRFLGERHKRRWRTDLLTKRPVPKLPHSFNNSSSSGFSYFQCFLFNPSDSHPRKLRSSQSDREKRLLFSLRLLHEESFPARARQLRRTVKFAGKLLGIRRSRNSQLKPIVPNQKREFE